jgi:hypothetical protein
MEAWSAEEMEAWFKGEEVKRIRFLKLKLVQANEHLKKIQGSPCIDLHSWEQISEEIWPLIKLSKAIVRESTKSNEER